MGSVEIEQHRDFWNHEWLGFGHAGTTSGVTHEEVKQNPIGFIWPKEEKKENE